MTRKIIKTIMPAPIPALTHSNSSSSHTKSSPQEHSPMIVPFPPYQSDCKYFNVYVRPFHYLEDHGGVKPKELSPYDGPKFKISEKLDQN